MTRAALVRTGSGGASAGWSSSGWADPARWGESLRRRLGRLGRWEFWPAWAVYGPLLPWLAWYAVRYGGPTVFTAANPGIPHGGLAGESKWEILRAMPRWAVTPSAFIPAGAGPRREALTEAERVGAYPLILKPDVGERGAGVCLARSRAEAEAYLERTAGAVVVQRYHAGPYEAGVFYARTPGGEGFILSLTDKEFPRVTGDGRRTLRALVVEHPRYHLQAPVFLERLGAAAGRVPGSGEVVGLGVAGNHCQGTKFLEGKGLVTPALTAAFDRIARGTPGFWFGRFDVRYSDPAAFARGEGFEVVELNGVGSESTNIYDPGCSFMAGQRVLRAQWRLAFEIGAAHVRAGARATPVRELVRAVASHVRRAGVDRRAD